MRKCKKVDPLEILLPSNTTCSAKLPLVTASPAFIYDIIACTVGMSVQPETYETTTWQINSYISTGYKRVDLAYNDSSIISNTKLSRAGFAVEQPILIKSKKLQIPSNYTTFLKTNHNMTRMIELVFNVTESAKGKVFNMLVTTKTTLSTENKCHCLTL